MYDLLEGYGVTRDDQRVAPPFGEQPMLNLHWYAACFPTLWDTMCRRVPGAATAARYAGGELYGWQGAKKLVGCSWEETISLYLRRYPEGLREKVARRLKVEIDTHLKLSNNQPIPDTDEHPLTGVSWKWLARIALRGDLKNRRRPLRMGVAEYRAYVTQLAQEIELQDEGREQATRA